MSQRVPFRRRTFLVRQGFQLRWSLAPVAALLLFLAVAGLHVYREAAEALRFESYRPHSRVVSTWELVGPATLDAAAVGGAGALVFLGLWGVLWFRRLRRDLSAVAAWLEDRAERPGTPPPGLGDREIRLLAEGFERGARTLEAWEREMGAAWEALGAELDAAEPDPEAVRSALGRIHRCLDRVRVDEGVR